MYTTLWSISQRVNQSINRSINPSINRSINQSTNQSINRSINQTVNRSIDRIETSFNQIGYSMQKKPAKIPDTYRADLSACVGNMGLLGSSRTLGICVTDPEARATETKNSGQTTCAYFNLDSIWPTDQIFMRDALRGDGVGYGADKSRQLEGRGGQFRFFKGLQGAEVSFVGLVEAAVHFHHADLVGAKLSHSSMNTNEKKPPGRKAHRWKLQIWIFFQKDGSFFLRTNDPSSSSYHNPVLGMDSVHRAAGSAMQLAEHHASRYSIECKNLQIRCETRSQKKVNKIKWTFFGFFSPILFNNLERFFFFLLLFPFSFSFFPFFLFPFSFFCFRSSSFLCLCVAF